MAKLDELDPYYQQQFLEAQTLGVETDEEILRRLLAQQKQQERLTQEQEAAATARQAEMDAADQQRMHQSAFDELRDPYPIQSRHSEEDLTQRISQKEEELTRQIWSQLNADPDYSHLTVEQLDKEARRLMRETSPMAWFQEGYTSKPAGDRPVSGVDVPELMRKVQTEDGRAAALLAGSKEVMKRQVLKPTIKEGEPSTDIGRYLLEQIDDETYAELAKEYPLFGIRWANEEGERPFLPPARSTRVNERRLRETPEPTPEETDEWRRRYEAFKEITVANEEIEAQREKIKVKLERAYREAQREAEETVLQKYRDQMYGEAAYWVDQALTSDQETALTYSDSEYEERREEAIQSLIDTVLEPYILTNLPEVAARRKKREKGEEDKESGLIVGTARDLWNKSTTTIDERGIVETLPRTAGRVVFNSVVNAITEIGSGAVGWEERADGSPVDPNDPNYIIWKQNQKRLDEGGSPWDPRYIGSYAFSVPMQRTQRDENAWRKPLPEVIVDSNASAIGQMYDRWIMSTLGSVQKSRYVGDDLATTRAFQQSMEALGVNPELAALGLSMPILIGTPITPFSTFNNIWRGTKAVTAATSDIGLDAAAWAWKVAAEPMLKPETATRLIKLGNDLASGKIASKSRAMGELARASGDIVFSATPLQALAASKGKKIQAAMLNSLIKEAEGARYADASMLRDMATRAANRLVSRTGYTFVDSIKIAESNATAPEAAEAMGYILSDVKKNPSLLKPERSQDLMEAVTDRLHGMLLQAVPNDIVYAMDNKDILMSGKTMKALRKPGSGWRKNSIMDDINESTRDWVKVDHIDGTQNFNLQLDMPKLEELFSLRKPGPKVQDVFARARGATRMRTAPLVAVNADEMLAVKYWTKGNLQLKAAREMGDGVVSDIRYSAHYRPSPLAGAVKAIGRVGRPQPSRPQAPLEARAESFVPRASVAPHRRQETARAIQTLASLFKQAPPKIAVTAARTAGKIFGRALDESAVLTLKDRMEPWTDPRIISKVEDFATEVGAVPAQFNLLLQQNQRLTGKPFEAFIKTINDIYAQSSNPSAQVVENFYSSFMGYFFNAPEAKGLEAVIPKSTPKWTVSRIGGRLKATKKSAARATLSGSEIRALLNAYKEAAGIEALTELTREHLSNLVTWSKQAGKGMGPLYEAAKITVDGDLVLNLSRAGKSLRGLKRSGVLSILDETKYGLSDGNLMAALGVSAQREMVEQIWHRMGRYLQENLPGKVVRIEPEPTKFPEIAPGTGRLEVHEQLVQAIIAQHIERLIRHRWGDDPIEIYTGLVSDLTRTGNMTDQGVEDWLLEMVQSKVASSDILEDTRKQLRSLAPGQAYEIPRRTQASPEVRRSMEEGIIDKKTPPGRQGEIFDFTPGPQYRSALERSGLDPDDLPSVSVPFVGPASDYKTFLYDELMRRIKPVASKERGFAKLREFPSGMRPFDLTRTKKGGVSKVQEMESLGKDKALMAYRRYVKENPGAHDRAVATVEGNLLAERATPEVKRRASILAFEASNPPKLQKKVRDYYDDRATYYLIDLFDHLGEESFWTDPRQATVLESYSSTFQRSPWGHPRAGVPDNQGVLHEAIDRRAEAHAPIIKKLWEEGLAFQDTSPGSLSDFVKHYESIKEPRPVDHNGVLLREEDIQYEGGQRFYERLVPLEEGPTYRGQTDKYYIPTYTDYPFTVALYEWLESIQAKIHKAIDEEYDLEQFNELNLSFITGHYEERNWRDSGWRKVHEEVMPHLEEQRKIKRPYKEILKDPDVVPPDLQDLMKALARHPDANPIVSRMILRPWKEGSRAGGEDIVASSFFNRLREMQYEEDVGKVTLPPWWSTAKDNPAWRETYLRDEYKVQEWENLKDKIIKALPAEDASLFNIILEKVQEAFPRPNSELHKEKFPAWGDDKNMRQDWKTWGTPEAESGYMNQLIHFAASIDAEELFRRLLQNQAPIADLHNYSDQINLHKKGGPRPRFGHRTAPRYRTISNKDWGPFMRQAAEESGQVPGQNLRAEVESILLEEAIGGSDVYGKTVGLQHYRRGLLQAYQESLTEHLHKSRAQMEGFVKKTEGGPDAVQVVPIYGDPRHKDIVETMLKQPEHYEKTSKAAASWEGLSREHRVAFNRAMDSVLEMSQLGMFGAQHQQKGQGFPIAYHISKMERGEITEEMMVYARDLGAEFNKHFPETKGVRPITFVKPVQTGIADQGKSLTWKDLERWSALEWDVATIPRLEMGRPIRSAPPIVTPRVPYKGIHPDEYDIPMMTVGGPKEFALKGPVSAPRRAPLTPDPKAPELGTRWRGDKRGLVQEEILPAGSPARSRALERLANAGFIEELEGKEKIFWLTDPLTAMRNLSKSPERIRNLVQKGLETAVYRYTGNTTSDIQAQMLKAGFPVGLTDIGNADALGPKILQIDPHIYMMTDPIIEQKIKELRGSGIDEQFGQGLERIQPKDGLALPFATEVYGAWMATRRMQASGLMGLSPRYQGINIISWPLIMMVTNPAFMLRTVTTMAGDPGSTVGRSLAERFGGRMGRRVGTLGGKPLEMGVFKNQLKRAWDNYYSGGADTVVMTTPDGTPWTQRMLDTEMRNRRALFSQVAFEFSDTDLEEMYRIARLSPDLRDPLEEYLKKMDSTTRGFNKEWFKLMAEGPARGGQEWARWFKTVFDPRNKTAFNRFAEAMDESFRRAAFIAALQAGESVEDAATVARPSILDYQRTTKLERRYLAKHRLFYSFARNSLVETLEALLRMDQGTKNMRAWYVAQNHIKKLMGTYMSQPDYADHAAFVIPTGEADYTPQMWKVGDVPFIQSLNTFTTAADVLYYGSPKQRGEWVASFLFQDPTASMFKELFFGKPKQPTDPEGFVNPRNIMRYKAADDFLNHFVDRSKKNGTWEAAQALYNIVPTEKPIPGGPMFEGSQWRFNDEKGFDRFAVMTWAALTTNTERVLTEMATAYFIAKGDTFSMDKVDRVELKRFKGGIIRAVIYISGVATPIQGTSEQQRELNMLWHAKQAVSGAEKTR